MSAIAAKTMLPSSSVTPCVHWIFYSVAVERHLCGTISLGLATMPTTILKTSPIAYTHKYQLEGIAKNRGFRHRSVALGFISQHLLSASFHQQIILAHNIPYRGVITTAILVCVHGQCIIVSVGLATTPTLVSHERVSLHEDKHQVLGLVEHRDRHRNRHGRHCATSGFGGNTCWISIQRSSLPRALGCGACRDITTLERFKNFDPCEIVDVYLQSNTRHL